ncbi:helix-turn-helix domain-containing protein [Treponema phagedenis]|uniref:helix-turn-helix domain-containing protein n=1 Tax=Treponema phagedenis TaxID=162 RepID=UPI001653386D|nr:helix-turn-helix transcriptional regulator [Treponema phagedenis]
MDTLIIKNNTKRQSVADYANIRPQAISNWISQQSLPRVDTAVKIAEYLNTTVEFLVTGKNPPHWKPPARIAPIVEILETLSDQDLEVVLKMVSGLVKE